MHTYDKMFTVRKLYIETENFNMKKVTSILLCFLLMFTAVCGVYAEDGTPVTGIEIIAEKTVFDTNDEYTFTVKSAPETARELKVVWSVDNYLVAPIIPNSGKILAAFPGEATITAALADYPEIKASLKITVNGSNEEIFRPHSASILLPENLYVSSKPAEYKYNLVMHSENQGIIPENLGGVGWSQYYTVEITDNFAGKKGITRRESSVIIAADAEPAKDLYISAVVKKKSTGETVASAESVRFNVIGRINITGIEVNGNTVEKGTDGKYTASVDGADEITVAAKADKAAYYSYQINGGINKLAPEGKIYVSALSGKNTIAVYVFGDNRKGASGYNTNGLAETVVIELNK